jgi:hypothetical protein
MRRLAAFTFVALTCFASRGSAQTSSNKPRAATQFIGTWRLVSFQGDSASRLVNRGPHPIGLIYYDVTGHMAVQIQPDRHRESWRPTQLPTPQQAVDAVNGYTAYFGTYSIDEKAHTVTHHRVGALNLDIVDYIRRYEFNGSDRLTLVPVDRPGTRLVWERIK